MNSSLIAAKRRSLIAKRNAALAARPPILLLCPAEFANGLTTYALAFSRDAEKIMIYEYCTRRLCDKFAQVGSPRLICVENRARANEVAILSRVLNDQARKKEDEFGGGCSLGDIDKMTVGFERDILTDVAERSTRHLGYPCPVKILHSEVGFDRAIICGILKEEKRMDESAEGEPLIGSCATSL